ncbi:MAG: hypothetical protein Q9191_005052 [Dirinaria sp. TL-2023a]
MYSLKALLIFGLLEPLTHSIPLDINIHVSDGALSAHGATKLNQMGMVGGERDRVWPTLDNQVVLVNNAPKIHASTDVPATINITAQGSNLNLVARTETLQANTTFPNPGLKDDEYYTEGLLEYQNESHFVNKEVPFIFRVTDGAIRLEFIPDGGDVGWLTGVIFASSTGPVGGSIKWIPILKDNHA